VELFKVEEMIEKLRNLECPFCSHRSKNFAGLVSHVTSAHPLEGCPVCGDFRGKDIVKHLAKKNDEAHRLLYAIYRKVRHKKVPESIREVRNNLFYWEG